MNSKIGLIVAAAVVLAIVACLSVQAIESEPSAAARARLSALQTPTVVRHRHQLHVAGRLEAAVARLRVQVGNATPRQKQLFTVLRHPLIGGAGQTAATATANSGLLTSISNLRTVYESANVATGLLPTTHGLCFVGTVAGIGSSLCTTTAAAAKGGLGLLVQHEREYTMAGVLPAGAKRAVIDEVNGVRVESPLNSNDGYAVTTEVEPANLVITEEDGAVYQIALNVGANHNGS